MDSKTRALLALIVFAADSLVVSVLNIFRASIAPSARILGLNAATVVFKWLMPILIVVQYERSCHESLGLNVNEKRLRTYILFVALGIIVPGFFLNYDKLLSDLLEQLLFIGLVEEFFYRGYLMSRLCEWKGRSKGLLLSSTIFSLAHVIFIISNEGLNHIGFLVSVTTQTFLGGVLLGYIYLREGNIIPSSIIHVSMNLYLPIVLG
jgi:membrane protease YdiL (CAAX protease family)